MQSGVCFGAGALWQGGARCCTSVSELSDLCRMGGWGRGWRLHNCVMSGSHLGYVMAAGAPHPLDNLTLSLFFSQELSPPPQSPHPVFLVTSGRAMLHYLSSACVSSLHFSTHSRSPPHCCLYPAYLFYYNSNCYYYFSCPPPPSD